jgi:uncharacterized protein YjiS (DUF1127 family)
MTEFTIDGLEPTEKVARLQDRIKALERERDALRKALLRLSDADLYDVTVTSIARAALEAKP